MEMTQKQEAFCMAYIETGNASEAYRRSYNAGKMKAEVIHVKACELLAKGNVSVRVAALQEEQRKRHAVTADTVTADAQRVFNEAMERGQLSAANSALTLISKLHGLLTDRVENKLSVDMTPERADEVLRGCGIDPEILAHG